MLPRRAVVAHTKWIRHIALLVFLVSPAFGKGAASLDVLLGSLAFPCLEKADCMAAPF